MMRTCYRIAIALGLAALLVACQGGTAPPPVLSPTPGAEPTAASAAEPVAEGRTVAADGRLESPYPELALGFGSEISGRVMTITVQAGDTVEAGEVLAELDDTELRRAVEDARRTLERAVADRERAQADWEQEVADAEKALADAERARTTARLEYSETPLERARTDLDRARKAEADAKDTYEKMSVMWPPVPVDGYRDAWERSIRDRELAEMALADAEDVHRADYVGLQARDADVEEAERALAALEDGIDPAFERAIEDAEDELAQAEESLAQAVLHAPWQALVLSVDVAPQATVEGSVPVVTLLDVSEGLRFASPNLSEQHIAEVTAGQQATIVLRTYAETELEAVVEAVVPQVEEAADAEARFTVYARLAEGAGEGLRLLPGLTGRVEIAVGE